jgi:hypothetical protein
MPRQAGNLDWRLRWGLWATCTVTLSWISPDELGEMRCGYFRNGF